MTTEVPMRAPRRARAILSEMVETGQLSSDGIGWLDMALDPFPDKPMCPVGYPDVTTARSVTHCVQVAQEISSAATTPWDCHIFFLPVAPTLDVTSLGAINPNVEYESVSITPGGILNPGPSGAFLSNTMNVLTMPSGTDWLTGPDVSNVSATTLDNANILDQWRLVGVGYELTDTTPALYKGGSLVAYRSPSDQVRSSFQQVAFPIDPVPDIEDTPLSSLKPAPFTTKTAKVSTAKTTDYSVRLADCLVEPKVKTTTVFQTMVADYLRTPPTNVAEATAYPGSATWGASEGIYQIGVMNDSLNPKITSVPNDVLLTPGLTAPFPDTYPAWIRNATCLHGCARALPYDVFGCILSGLAPEATFKLVVRYYLERFPTSTNEMLLSISKPSPNYDPMAIHLYSKAINELPVAVPVKENPLGEWFNDVLSAVADNAGKIGNALGTVFPLAPAIGNLVGGAARGIRSLISDQPASNVAAVPRQMRQPQPRKEIEQRKYPKNAEYQRIKKQNTRTYLAPANGGAQLAVPQGRARQPLRAVRTRTTVAPRNPTPRYRSRAPGGGQPHVYEVGDIPLKRRRRRGRGPRLVEYTD